MDTPPAFTENTPHPRPEELLLEQTILLRQILNHLQEDRRNKRIWTTVAIVVNVLKYTLIAFIAYSFFLFVTTLLNDTVTRVEKSVPTIPSFSIDSLPGLDKIR